MTKQEYMSHALLTGLMAWTPSGEYFQRLDISNFEYVKKSSKKLVLHPLSDLTKPIEHRGETFVPMFELANICYNNIFTTKPTIKEYEVLFDDTAFRFIGYTDEERISLTYVDDFNRNEFEFWLSKNKMKIKQLVLFQKLIEWKFDIANLISKGEAIDVNTLDINPYK